MTTPQPTHQAWEARLIDILDQYGLSLATNNRQGLSRKDAKFAIYAAVLELVVGEDESALVSDEDRPSRSELEQHFAVSKNALRDQQRQTITGKPNPQ